MKYRSHENHQSWLFLHTEILFTHFNIITYNMTYEKYRIGSSLYILNKDAKHKCIL